MSNSWKYEGIGLGYVKVFPRTNPPPPLKNDVLFSWEFSLHFSLAIKMKMFGVYWLFIDVSWRLLLKT